MRAACGIMPDWNGDGMDEFWAFITQSDEDFTGIYVFDGHADWKTNGADLDPIMMHLTSSPYQTVVGPLPTSVKWVMMVMVSLKWPSVLVWLHLLELGAERFG